MIEVGDIVAFRPSAGYRWRTSQFGRVVEIDGGSVTIEIPVIDWRGQWIRRTFAVGSLVQATAKERAILAERFRLASRGESFGTKGRLSWSKR